MLLSQCYHEKAFYVPHKSNIFYLRFVYIFVSWLNKVCSTDEMRSKCLIYTLMENKITTSQTLMLILTWIPWSSRYSVKIFKVFSQIVTYQWTACVWASDSATWYNKVSVWWMLDVTCWCRFDVGTSDQINILTLVEQVQTFAKIDQLNAHRVCSEDQSKCRSKNNNTDWWELLAWGRTTNMCTSSQTATSSMRPLFASPMASQQFQPSEPL